MATLPLTLPVTMTSRPDIETELRHWGVRNWSSTRAAVHAAWIGTNWRWKYIVINEGGANESYFVNVCNETSCTITIQNNLKQMMRRDAGMLPETVKFIIFCLLQVPDLTCPYLLFPFSIEVYIEEPPLDWPHEMNGVCAISILYGSVLYRITTCV